MKPYRDMTLEEIEAVIVYEYLSDPELLRLNKKHREEILAVMRDARETDAIHKVAALALRVLEESDRGTAESEQVADELARILRKKRCS